MTAIGSQLIWYTDTSELGTTTAPVPTTGRIGTQTYRVSQTINNCESEQIPILVTIQERAIEEVGVEVILPTNENNGSILFTGLLPDSSYVVSYTKDSIVAVSYTHLTLPTTPYV